MNGLKGKILEEKHKNLQNRNGVSYMDGSFFDDFGKNSLGRHDALTYFLLNGTSFVAFLANLAVPVAGVGVPDNAVIALADGSVNRGFNHTFFFGYVNRCNSAFDHMLITSFLLYLNRYIILLFAQRS